MSGNLPRASVLNTARPLFNREETLSGPQHVVACGDQIAKPAETLKEHGGRVPAMADASHNGARNQFRSG